MVEDTHRLWRLESVELFCLVVYNSNDLLRLFLLIGSVKRIFEEAGCSHSLMFLIVGIMIALVEPLFR